MTDTIKIANCSGFYGDKLSAAKDMVDGGPIDVLTGDYLAELTMTILYNQRSKKPDAGYVGTFLKQVKDVLATCMEKNIKIVTNAGGLNPSGMAVAVSEIAKELDLDVKVAYIEGDDLMPRLADLQEKGELFENIDTQQNLADGNKPPVTANAYLGAWGIKTALDMGADVVICPRVTDAAVVIGPAAWKFNWQRQDYDALAGALAAGHIIECGAQATGGNYAFFQEVPSFHNMGYPIAEIEANPRRRPSPPSSSTAARAASPSSFPQASRKRPICSPVSPPFCRFSNRTSKTSLAFSAFNERRRSANNLLARRASVSR